MAISCGIHVGFRLENFMQVLCSLLTDLCSFQVAFLEVAFLSSRNKIKFLGELSRHVSVKKEKLNRQTAGAFCNGTT